MALQKTITTPAGNVLGNYGVVGSVHLNAKPGTPAVITVQGATLSLYASQTAFAAGSPAVAVYQYGCGGAVLASGADPITVAETAILTTVDAGTFQTAGMQQGPQQGRGWTPGWTGGSHVA